MKHKLIRYALLLSSLCIFLSSTACQFTKTKTATAVSGEQNGNGNAQGFAGGGNGEGFEGGDKIRKTVADAAADLYEATVQLETHFAEASLCQRTACNDSRNKALCEEIGRLTDEQATEAAGFVVENLQGLKALFHRNPAEEFSFTTASLNVNGLPVPALTNPAGDVAHEVELAHVLFSYLSLVGMSLDAVRQLVFHEDGHNVTVPSLGRRVKDADQIGHFTSATGGQELLNAAGACLSVYASNLKAYRESVLAAGPLGYWRLDDAAGSTSALDSSGRGYAAPVRGAVTFGGEGALAYERGTSAAFSNGTATDSGLSLQLPAAFAESKRATVELWMKWDGSYGGSNDGEIVFGFEDYSLTFTGGKFGFNTGYGDLWGMDATLLANRWVHVVAVFENGNARLSKLYIDGVSQTLSQQIGITTPGSKLASSALVSGWSVDARYRFSGSLDELAVYDFDLAAYQVQEHYQAGAAHRN